ncbi:MAG: uracil-DNA glycosylase [Parachlamydiales bacterium]|nr:uracil-DNA glycosylase [Parachlamydiales bacterium]
MGNNTLDSIAFKIKRCKKCPLCRSRIKAVAGEGKINARILILGESPGSEEDRVGVPFVGKAGRLLDELLLLANLKRKDIFITNLVKCHPQKNKDPKKNEILTCMNNYLFNQLEIIKPKIIITLGRYSSKYLLENFNIKFSSISKLHGKVKNIDKITIIPMYHPAYGLYNAKKLKIIKKDFSALKV